jgi:nuclear pore complex protein Nup210
VTGRCVGINPATGSQIIFSEDSIHIHVVPLTGVQIKTPLTRLKTGAVAPASIWAKPDISPLVLGTLDSLKVQWSTDQPDVVEIKGIFDDVGVRYRDRDSIAVRLRALSPGKANIYAIVWTGNNVKTTVSCEITVFKQLELEQPKRIVYDPILIPPKSSIQLMANLNDVTYELESDVGSVLKVSKNGLVKSGDANGRTLVIVSELKNVKSKIFVKFRVFLPRQPSTINPSPYPSK